MLRTKNLSKHYEKTVAVENLNLNVRAGEIYGFLGPNGAGKTTTIRLLLGLLQPTSGDVFLFDTPISQDAIALKRRIGVVAEEPLATTRMTAWEFIHFYADLNQVARPEGRMDELFKALDLWDVRHALAAAYSRGMRQKLSLIRALVHRPDLLILDEPVNGLDPHGILQVRAVIDQHRDQGGAVLISSHILSEIERSADRIGIMHQGRLLVEDDISGIRSRLGGNNIVELVLTDIPPGLAGSLSALEGVTQVEIKERAVAVHVNGGKDIRPEIFKAIVAQNGTIIEMGLQQMSLEEAFVTITHQNVAQLAGAA
ncbi:MAG: ABC transporter ATP-binding protein [Anaerolineales bacterium]|nr:ABC transporter ATP-binding protein [Anaerolineales bacterium]